MTAPVTISPVDGTHFALNGRSLPRVFLVFPSGNEDALIVSAIDARASHTVALGSEVDSATPTDQAALIAALAGVVGGIGGAGAGGGGGGGGGDATAANQVAGNNTLTAINGKLPAQVSGRVPVVVGAALPAGANNIGDVDVLTLPATAATTTKQDEIKEAIEEGTVPLSALVSGSVANTSGNNTAVIAAQGAGVQTILTDLTITNSSEAGVLVEVKDGSTTRWSAFVPAKSGITHRFASPLVGTANTAWNVDAASATTTIYASFSGFKVSA